MSFFVEPISLDELLSNLKLFIPLYRRVVNKTPPYNKTRNQTFGEFWKIIRPREEKLGAKRPKKIGFLLFYKGKSPKNMIKNWHIIRPFSVYLENFWKIIKP